MIKGNKCICDRCEYEWKPLKLAKDVKICPRCKSYMWNIPRIRKKKESMWNKPKRKIKKKLNEKMNKNKIFKCHMCGNIILTKSKKIKCDSCKSDYTLENGKYYRENVYSKAYEYTHKK